MLTVEIVSKRADEDSILVDVIVKQSKIDIGLITYRIRKNGDNKLTITVLELISLSDELTSDVRILAVKIAIDTPALVDVIDLNMTIFEQDLELFKYILDTYGAEPTYLNKVYYINVYKDRFELPRIKPDNVPKGRGETLPLIMTEAPLEELFNNIQGDE